MKKILSVIISCAMALSVCAAMAGCNSGNENSQTGTTTAATTKAADAGQTPQEGAAGESKADEQVSAQSQANGEENAQSQADEQGEAVSNAEEYDGPADPDSIYRATLIAGSTGKTITVTLEDATDRYDTASAFLRDLDPDTYDVVISGQNGADMNQVASTSFDCSEVEGPTNIRINFYLVVSEVEVTFTE